MERVKLEAVPISLINAGRVVSAWHRHHKAPQGGLFAVGCRRVGQSAINGVAIIGRPVSRRLDDGFSAEITRLCTDGTPNACSFLYGLAWRICESLGYKRLITYTLLAEDGSSCRAANMTNDLVSKGGEWNCVSRPRKEGQFPIEPKRRWYYGEMSYTVIPVTIPCSDIDSQLELDI